MSNFKRNSSNEINDFQPAKIWLNIGVEVGGKIITLPVGIPLGEDTKTRGADQASLLQAILGMADAVPAGEQQQLTGLQLYIRKVADEQPAAVDLGLKLKLK